MPNTLTKEQKENYVERNKKLVENAQNINYTAWHELSQEGYRFAHNIQLTQTELDDLRSAGMPDFIINKITPTIELARFFVTNRDPKWVPSGFKGDDTEAAHVVDTMTERSWYLSDGRDLIFRVITDVFTKSLGYFYVYVDSNLDKGKGEVLYGHVNSWNVFVEPTSTHKLFKDSGWMIIKDDLSRSRLIQEHPKHKAIIEKAQSGKLYENYFKYMGVNFTIASDIDEKAPPTEITHEMMAFKDDGEADDILDRYRGFFRVKKLFYNVFINVPPSEEEMKLIKLEVQQEATRINKEMDVQLLEQKQKLDEALEGGMLQQRYDLEMEKMKSETVRQKKIIFENLLQEKINKGTVTEAVVMSEAEWKLYEQNGEFRQYVLSKTEFYEDAIELVITIGDQFISRTKIPGKHIPLVPVHYIYTGTPFPISMSSLLVGKQREMNKSHQLIIHNANLGSNLRWMFKKGSIETKVWRKFVTTPGALLPVMPGQDYPKEVMPLPLSNAFVYLTEKAGADFHFLSGMQAAAQGQEEAQHETFKGQVKIDEMGTRRIRDWVHNLLDPALEHLGKIYMDFARALYTDKKVFRIHNEEYEKVAVINERVTDKFGNVSKVLNDLSVMDFDIKVVPGSTMPSNRDARYQNALIMHREGIGDDELVIRESDIKDKDDLIKRKTKLARTTQENESLKEQIKKLNGDLETLERMVLTSRLKAQEVELSGKMLKTILDAQSRIRKGELKSESDVIKATDEYKNTLQSMLNEAEMDIKDLVKEQTESDEKEAKEMKKK